MENVLREIAEANVVVVVVTLTGAIVQVSPLRVAGYSR